MSPAGPERARKLTPGLNPLPGAGRDKERWTHVLASRLRPNLLKKLRVFIIHHLVTDEFCWRVLENVSNLIYMLMVC